MLIVGGMGLLGLIFRGGEPGAVGHVQDEALSVGRMAASFPAADEDYFKGMDGNGGIDGKGTFTPEQIRGRNTWMVWTGGNDRFWDDASLTTFGNFDMLKVLSSYPGLGFSRDTRFKWFGLINEPCFQRARGPNEDRFGLWLDFRSAGCAPDPFENEDKYPGVEIGARGTTVPIGSYYGYATGVLGLRLFPNPAFDAVARKKWDPIRYYTDPSYYNAKGLVRPYRVGMSCAFCHVGPNPVAPPADPENPKFENLSATVGAQYFWFDRIFSWSADTTSYVFQLIHTSRPGALDTSLVSTDYINNPRTMNAIYNVGARLDLADKLGRETLALNNLQNLQLTRDIQKNAFQNPSTVFTPHVLKDGSDSVGALGALNRVYLNIGLFSEEWLLHFNAFIGGQTPTPIRIKVARQNSSYWNATEAQTTDMARFLAAAGVPHKLVDAPGGLTFLNDPDPVVARGRAVFAERCARCHSSKLPPIPAGDRPWDCADYLTCWKNYWKWTKTSDFQTQMRTIVDAPDFLNDNYLSTDIRVPASLLQTNLCSPMASNSIGGMVWDDFSSTTFKQLSPIGKVTVTNPIDGSTRAFDMPGGGRGYTRPASLVSLWSTAPFLLNNTVGGFKDLPQGAIEQVKTRMSSFDDAIRQMLWPERRLKDTVFATQGVIDRLPEAAYLSVPVGFLPGAIKALLGPLSAVAPNVFVDDNKDFTFAGTTAAGSKLVVDVDLTSFSAGALLTSFSAGAPVSGPGIAAGTRVVLFDAAKEVLQLDTPATASARTKLHSVSPQQGVKIGPIPKGTPVNLLAAVELAPEHDDLISRVRHDAKLVSLLLAVEHDVSRLGKVQSAVEREQIQRDLNNRLYGMSKCPDYVVNRGHYFGTDLLREEKPDNTFDSKGLDDSDKEALIAFLKRF